MKGEKNSFNLYVINKLTKPMTRLVKTIMGVKQPHCSATDFQNMYASMAWPHASPCADSKSSEGLKPSGTPNYSMYLFSTFCRCSISPPQGYMHHIRMLCRKSVFIETRIVRTNFSAHRLTLHFFNFTTCNLPSTEQTKSTTDLPIL